MAVVGQFPLHSDLRRRTVKAPTNPMDRSTIISIFPRAVEQRNPTIDPGLFIIPPGTYEKPSTLVVGSSSWWKEVDENQPLLEIPHSSPVIAESVIRDYCNGIIGCDMGENMPGLFFIPGELSIDTVKKDYQDMLNEANRKQRTWFTSLIRMADALWSRSQGNPLSISDDMRMAAREMGLITKEWYKDNIAVELVRCNMCGTLRNPMYPMCANCKHIENPEKAKSFGLVFAQ